MIAQLAALTRITFTELVRQKIFSFILVFALLAVGSSVFLAQLTLPGGVPDA